MSGLRKAETIRVYACTTKDQENLKHSWPHSPLKQNPYRLQFSSRPHYGEEPVVEQTNKTKQSKKNLAINSSANRGLESSHNHANKHSTFGTPLVPVSKRHLGNFFVRMCVNWVVCTAIFLSLLRKKDTQVSFCYIAIDC